MLLSLLVVSAPANKVQVMKVSKEAVTALKNKNMAKLSTLVHPTKGVRFTPYSYVDKNLATVFSQSQIVNAWDSKKVYTWGESDGSGDTMSFTFAKYFERFVYDRNFANAPLIKYSGAAAFREDLTNNFAEAYPNAKFVKYHFDKGPAPRYNEIGWASLYLIFEKSGKKWYLVGISHLEWTI